MSKVFRVRPKRRANQNGERIDPSMEVVVVTKNSGTSPFMNGSNEVTDAFRRIYGTDIKKGNYHKDDFEVDAEDGF